MAQPQTAPPVTEDAFLADRQKFLQSFTSFVFGGAATVAIILALLAMFLL